MDGSPSKQHFKLHHINCISRISYIRNIRYIKITSCCVKITSAVTKITRRKNSG